MKKQHSAEEQIRDHAAALSKLIDSVKDRNPPLADRAQAILNDAVEMAARVASK